MILSKLKKFICLSGWDSLLSEAKGEMRFVPGPNTWANLKLRSVSRNSAWGSVSRPSLWQIKETIKIIHHLSMSLVRQFHYTVANHWGLAGTTVSVWGSGHPLLYYPSHFLSVSTTGSSKSFLPFIGMWQLHWQVCAITLGVRGLGNPSSQIFHNERHDKHVVCVITWLSQLEKTRQVCTVCMYSVYTVCIFQSQVTGKGYTPSVQVCFFCLCDSCKTR